MARKRSFSTAQKGGDINISPLIDMVFILLIFFIVTTVFVDERGFEATKPDTADKPDEESEPVIFRITVNQDVFHGRENIGIAGVGRVVRNHLQHEELPVIIQVEKGARSEVALRVFDESLQAGASAVNLTHAR